MFIRNIEDVEDFVKDKQVILGKFIDLDENKNVDKKSKNRLNKLKLDKLPMAYKSPNENIITFPVSYKIPYIARATINFF